MNFSDLKTQREIVLLDCISGSTVYNLRVATSDTDKKGVFMIPRRQLYGFGGPDQLSSERNDEVYYELARFMDLLTKNNPNILELLYTPEEFVLYKHPLIDLIKPSDFLSKLCQDTFAGYAQTQLKKARGLNKKINKPLATERKTVLDFCYVLQQNGSVQLGHWLDERGYVQESCGLTRVPHFRDVYLLYHQHQFRGSHQLNGIISGSKADDVQLSPISKGIDHLGVMSFNKDGYSSYCREYREFREWESTRNQLRYEHTQSIGKNYDAKNMMHMFRLLNMAEEIALHQELRVYRPDRYFLLKIRSGGYSYEDLVKMADDKLEKMKELYEQSSLPDLPDFRKAEETLVAIREGFYRSGSYHTR